MQIWCCRPFAYSNLIESKKIGNRNRVYYSYHHYFKSILNTSFLNNTFFLSRDSLINKVSSDINLSLDI